MVNSRSLTVAELIGVDNVMHFVRWFNLFIAEQVTGVRNGFITKKTVIQQDNTSSIQLERNGKQ